MGIVIQGKTFPKEELKCHLLEGWAWDRKAFPGSDMAHGGQSTATFYRRIYEAV